MFAYAIEKINHKNAGIAREWALCKHYSVERTMHDHTPYDKGSDLDAGEKHISIKSSHFTLMGGALCEGLTNFDDIWNLYERKVHSNTFTYITEDYTAYEMTKSEFKKFVYAFCALDKDSSSNGGRVKIRCRRESKKMLAWLAANTAA